MDSTIIVALIGGITSIIVTLINNQLRNENRKIKLDLKRFQLQGNNTKVNTPKVTIESPRNGDVVSNRHEDVVGRIEGEIPFGYHLVVFHTRVDQGYWPQGEATDIDGKRLNKNTKRWKIKQYLNQNTTIKAVLISADVKILFDYYHFCCKKIFREANEFPDIPNLPIDGVINCDEVTVDFKSNKKEK